MKATISRRPPRNITLESGNGLTVPSRRPVRVRPKLLVAKLLLLIASVGVTLLLCEGALRVFFPKFKYAAESEYRTDQTRIWSRNPNTRYVRANPDTGATHAVCHNNLGLRQHRDFPPDDLRGAMNVGAFGDSFVENLRLPVQFSFTEPLDFLLNADGGRANALNFGVDGYGTDQCYLAYRDFPAKAELRQVLYVFCANDVRNIHENQLFTLDARGALTQRPPRPTSAFVRFLSHFHLTYLVVETIEGVLQRRDEPNKRVDLARFLEHARNYRTVEAERIQDDFVNQRSSALLDENLRLLVAILRQWRDEVQATGGQFHVVLLPRVAEHRAAARFAAAGLSVIDLYTADRSVSSPDEAERKELFFARDGHWNERGNQLAAVSLYERLARAPASRPQILERLGYYYSAMGDAQLPDGTPIAHPAPDAGAIRRKYRALE